MPINPKPEELKKDNPTTQKGLYYSLNKTNLDVENPHPLGGPNRTNSKNIPTGQYLNIGTHNITDLNGEVTLKEKDGNEVITKLNRWTPNNTYLDSGDWKNKYPNPPNTNKKSNLGSSVLDVINSLNPFPKAGGFGGGI